MAEQDAARVVDAYVQKGRLAARVTPKAIRRSDNRVDLVFEVFEGGLVEIERLSFVGNKTFSERRLRRVLGTKQAGPVSYTPITLPTIYTVVAQVVASSSNNKKHCKQHTLTATTQIRTRR